MSIAAGFSGHGFKFSTAIGQLLADLADEGESTLASELFKLKRYDRVELPLSHAIDLLEIQTPSSADIAGAWYTIGISHYLQTHYDKAIEPLKRYIEVTSKAKHEIDASEPPRAGTAREGLRSPHRRERDREVEGADRHDLSGARVRGPRGRYVQNLPYVRRDYETADRALQGEMKITITLVDADGGTEVLGVHEGLPPGVSIADNQDGWQSALARLAALVEAG